MVRILRVGCVDCNCGSYGDVVNSFNKFLPVRCGMRNHLSIRS